MAAHASFHGWNALVTGASSGLGAEFARQLAPQVAKLVLVARRAERLKELAAILHRDHPRLTIETLVIDLASPTARATLPQRLQDLGIELDLLINNAGLGDLGIFENADETRNREMIEVNIQALTHLTHAFLPGMIARKRGVILNIGSIAGYLPLPTFAVYAATKAYVNSFSESLYWEVYGTGVTVTAVCPGPIPTEFSAVAVREKGVRALNSPGFVQIDAKQAVAEALQEAKQGMPRVVPGGWMRFGAGFLGKIPFACLRLGYRFGAVAKAQAQRVLPK